MRNKRRNSIRSSVSIKVFGLTTALLLLFSVSLYMLIYTLLPPTYKQYKQQQLEKEMDRFVAASVGLSDSDFAKELASFRESTHALVNISDEAGHPLFPTLQIAAAEPLQGSSLIAASNMSPPTAPSETSKVIRPMSYQGQSATMTAYLTLQPIDEASRVLLLLLPYVALFIFISAVGGSFVYAIFITKPIRKITTSAGLMADLQLDTRIPVDSSDEIGRLAASLNTMAANLQGSIGELKTANEQLHLEMIRERQTESRRRELFAAVSHELKSPLTVLKGQLEGMLYRIGIYKNRDLYLEKTLKVADEMEQLIADILRVTRTNGLALATRFEEVPLHELVDGLLARYEELGLQRGVGMRSSVMEEIWIRTDRHLLENALNNVAHNAILYTNPGEQVVLRATRETDGRTLEIWNTGARIDEAKIGRIFEPFFREEQSRSRNTGGSGLGLYLTRNLLQQLGFSIQARNTEEGVVFSIHFPQRANEPEFVNRQVLIRGQAT